MDTTGCKEWDNYSLLLTALKVLGGLLMDPLRARISRAPRAFSAQAWSPLCTQGHLEDSQSPRNDQE